MKIPRIITQRRVVLKTTFVRTFEDARPEYLEDTACLLELSYMHSQFAEHRDETDVAGKRREERCDAICGMANSMWSLRCVVHHCKHSCCKSWEDQAPLKGGEEPDYSDLGVYGGL